ncbi:MAG TPA: gliding motility-associated C-terminal domain-containing protein [Flavisolibacter sp.]|nr:gliding motility-associated C-terminal domain-containing protein [Flavisolibacter sp.]
MRGMLTLFFLLLLATVFAQRPLPAGAQVPLDTTKPPPPRITTTTNIEICDNNTDDDGNGLKDCEDYSCYFGANANTCNCVPSSTIWIATGNGNLYWVNIQTGQEAHIGSIGRNLSDLTWTNEGKLYGVDLVGGLNIYQLNPTNAQASLVANVPGYGFSNAMTSDQNGNLYFAALEGNLWKIIKYSLSTGQVTVIADLSSQNLISGGDLAFSNGTLYCACTNNRIAVIDVNTGAVQSASIQGLPAGANIFGIVSAADGSLYLSGANRIYKLDPANMQATLAYTCTSFSVEIWGMANYNDNCQAAPCDPKVKVDILSAAPFCNTTGVSLKAEGTGLAGNAEYKWTLPDGSQVTGQDLTARIPGKYKVVYGSGLACTIADSVTLDVGAAPDVSLGPDAFLCNGSQLLLQNNDGAQGSPVWQDGSTQPVLTVAAPGIYWLELSNACGVTRDSIVVAPLQQPVADIGSDRTICPFDFVELSSNINETGYQYTWSNGSNTPGIRVRDAGIYWLDITNACGTQRDSLEVKIKTSGCECFLYVPTAFTPDGDGKNDLLRLHGTCRVSGELLVYNRWGQVVFRTRDLSKPWNGSLNGKSLSSEVFVYIVQYRFRDDPTLLTQKGTITLIR